MQVAGLIELAGVVDDWWSLGREMEVDSKTTEVEEVRKLVKRRRQELIDLIFKYTLHLDDQTESVSAASTERQRAKMVQNVRRSEEHTSELQSRFDLVCRLLLDKINQ